MNFESKIAKGVAGLLDDQHSQIVVDSIEPISAGDARAFSVYFHLEGAWGSPAGFLYPFVEDVPLEETLAALREHLSRSWRMAHMPPPLDAGHTTAGYFGD